MGPVTSEIGALWSVEPGLADSGDLEADFIELIGLLSRAAFSADSAVGIFWSDLHLLNKGALGALIGGLHSSAQQGASVLLFGAGMPQLRRQVTEAKSYAERMFVFYDVI